ncbi:MAG: hypothetical protein AB7F28_07030 [Candidatus Margulisiibacteriota bacterium]
MASLSPKESTLRKALVIATKTLKDRYSPLGIQAGKRHFSDLWTRDACYAGLGSLCLGDYKAVRQSLCTILDNQDPSGHLPVRVGQVHFLLKFLFGYSGTPEPRYREDKGVSLVVDGNALTLILAQLYVEVAQDPAFLDRYFKPLQKAITWLEHQHEDRNAFVQEGPYAGWADSTRKQGAVLYTNVLFWKAQSCFETLAKRNGNTHAAELAHKKQEHLKTELNKAFWENRYFIDWISQDGEKHCYFATDGNLLAIVLGLATPEQAKLILDTIAEHQMENEGCIQTNFPTYRKNLVFFPFRLIGLHDYHNGMRWLWLGCLNAVAEFQMGLKDQAHNSLLQIADLILRNNGVYEVYDQGKPVNRLFYKSEEGFAWSSGLFIWAYHVLHEDLTWHL